MSLRITSLAIILLTASVVILWKTPNQSSGPAFNSTQKIASKSNLPCCQHHPEKKPKNSTINLANISAQTIGGKRLALLGDTKSAGLGVVFLSTECPIARRYIPELGQIHQAFQSKNIPVIGILSDPTLTRAQAQQWKKEFQPKFPVAFDTSGQLLASLGPTHTPEAFVLSRQGEILYRGRIDDFFANVGQPRQQAYTHEFRDALHALSRGQSPKSMYEKPVGCPVEIRPAELSQQPVTYCRDVAPILFEHCASCHHAGSVAPFSLTDYQDAAKRAQWISEVSQTGLMPPWKAQLGFGHFQDERFLTDHEKMILKQWAQAGAPFGNKDDLPPRPTFSKDWQLGKPDLVVKMPKPVDVPAGGGDLFRYIAVPIELPADHFVTGFEFRPGNANVVHHAIVAQVPAEIIQELAATAEMPSFDVIKDGLPRMIQHFQKFNDDKQSSSFGLLGAWVPGMTASQFPPGVGIPMPKKTTLMLQMHYYPSGKPETDQSEVALYFSKKPIERQAFSFAMNSLNFKIPAGDAHYKIVNELTLPARVELIGINPHMHLLGKTMKVTAKLPNGQVENLIYVNQWDWNWQGQYRYQTPMKLPQGTTLRVEAVYDNSTRNPLNPISPPKAMGFGRKTTDEMCLCAFQCILNDPADAKPIRRAVMHNVIGQFGPAFAAKILFSSITKK